jgi:hypothetical protein
MFARVLRGVVGEYEREPADVDAEIDRLRHALLLGGGSSAAGRLLHFAAGSATGGTPGCGAPAGAASGEPRSAGDPGQDREGQDLSGTDPAVLSLLLALGGSGAGDAAAGPDWREWGDGEMADVLRHQLGAPLLFDLGRSGPDRNAGGGERPAGPQGSATPAGAPPIASFGDLLRHPAPPVELLILVKEFGRAGRAGRAAPIGAEESEGIGGTLPPEVGTLLYYAAIAAARVRHGRRITSMGDDDLRNGVEWALQQPWLDGPTRELFRQWHEALSQGG